MSDNANAQTDSSSDDSAEIAQWLVNFARLLSGDSKTCLRCGADIETLEQSGRSVYAAPCGCRQYQGSVPAAWRQK